MIEWTPFIPIPENETQRDREDREHIAMLIARHRPIGYGTIGTFDLPFIVTE